MDERKIKFYQVNENNKLIPINKLQNPEKFKKENVNPTIRFSVWYEVDRTEIQDIVVATSEAEAAFIVGRDSFEEFYEADNITFIRIRRVDNEKSKTEDGPNLG